MDSVHRNFGKMMVIQDDVRTGVKELLIKGFHIAGSDVAREIIEHLLCVHNIEYDCDYDSGCIYIVKGVTT